jgi:beta-phosphoglucomutase-like phosphatase (HAD superfamily)
LPDVFAVTDRIVVLHCGHRVAEKKTSESDSQEIVQYMVCALDDNRAPVRQRIAQMDHSGEQVADALMIVGARAFLQGLHDRGVTMYLASGTDHVYVMEEATALGVTAFFGRHIYGAQDDRKRIAKSPSSSAS